MGRSLLQLSRLQQQVVASRIARLKGSQDALRTKLLHMTLERDRLLRCLSSIRKALDDYA